MLAPHPPLTPPWPATVPVTETDARFRLEWMVSALRTTATAPAVPCLLWLGETGLVRMQTVEDGLVIGWDPRCGLVLAGPGVARWHCRINSGARGVNVDVLGPAGLTKVNGSSVAGASCRLCDGDVIDVGGVQLLLVI